MTNDLFVLLLCYYSVITLLFRYTSSTPLPTLLSGARGLMDWRKPPLTPPPLPPVSLCRMQPLRLLSPPQRMVLPAVPRGAQPHVLSLRVRRQKQLLFADQSGLLHQPRPPHVLPLHRPLHRHGERRGFLFLSDGHCTAIRFRDQCFPFLLCLCVLPIDFSICQCRQIFFIFFF